MGPPDEARIRRVLTMEGSVPEGYAFLVDSFIYIWNPATHFRLLLLHDSALANTIRAQLTASGRVFDSLDHAAEFAIAQKWDNWEKLLTPYDEGL